MNDRHSLLDSITGVLVPIHRDGHKFVVGFAVATLRLFWSPRRSVGSGR